MRLPASKTQQSESAPPTKRSGLSICAQVTLTSCIGIILWEVLVRLTTTNNRTPTQISMHWTRCDDQDQPPGWSTDEPLAGETQIPENTSTSENASNLVQPTDTGAGAELVVPFPEQNQTNTNSVLIGKPIKTVAEKRACIYEKFSGGSLESETRTFSQFFEDGIISAIYQCLVPETKYYVEFGVENGMECTTRNLRENGGWTGLLMDGGYENEAINLKKEFFTAENIAGLFEKHRVPKHFDHFTIDIDQNTFWVLHSVLLAGFRPRSLVVEINRNFHPADSFVVPYNASRMWDATNVFGASVGAFATLLSDFGYQLIAIDQDQINLYAIDSAEVGSKPVLSFEEVVAGVQKIPLCSPVHPCPPTPTVFMQVPANASLARPRHEWYSSLPLWSLTCAGSVSRSKVLFTGVLMDTPADATPDSILGLPAAPVQHLAVGDVAQSTPCSTVAAVNAAVAAAESQVTAQAPPA